MFQSIQLSLLLMYYIAIFNHLFLYLIILKYFLNYLIYPVTSLIQFLRINSNFLVYCSVKIIALIINIQTVISLEEAYSKLLIIF